MIFCGRSFLTSLCQVLGLASLAWLATAGDRGAAAEPIRVVQPADATTAQRLAVDELVMRLRRLYPDEQFTVGDTAEAGGRQVLIAELKTGAELLAGRIDRTRLRGSFNLA